MIHSKGFSQFVQISELLNRHYIKAVISEAALKVDTAQYRAELRECDQIDSLRLFQLAQEKFETNQERQIADNYKQNYTVLETKYARKERWNKRLIRFGIVVSAIIVTEAGIIYLVVKP